MVDETAKKDKKFIYFIAAIGLIFPLLLVTGAFLAAKSDAEKQKHYQELYDQQQAKVKEKFAAEKQAQNQETSVVNAN